VAFERLTVVGDETEAELIRSLLSGDGIDCFVRQTDFAAGATSGSSRSGPQEILVDADDLERARELLAAKPVGELPGS
jgi:Putative prokaryotic signal transducing protein